MFQATTEELLAMHAEITVREIKQQPELWQEAWSYYKEEQERINHFLTEIKEKHNHVRVIFTGAGSSAYVGDTVLPYLKQVGDESAFDFQSVPTTSLVSNPASFFKKEIPTILVSFARSGNSPESVASVELGKQIVADFYQITITCAPEGKLALGSKNDEKNLLLMMPARSNDQGFAMTGSFSCMTLTALLVFDPTANEKKEQYVNQIEAMGNEMLAREDEVAEITGLDFNRVIYLGSGPAAGIAREVQLKILELTAGKVATAFDSSLGFRHGPKSFVDEKSLVFLYVSSDPYTRKYDLDMLKELAGDQIAERVTSIEVEQEENFDGHRVAFDAKFQELPDGYLALPYAIFGQMVSVYTAVKVGNKPDTPSPTGTVNRVVKGVIVHEFNQ